MGYGDGRRSSWIIRICVVCAARHALAGPGRQRADEERGDVNRESFDVVVVGNGVIGLSIALAVVNEQPSASIAVIGPVDRDGGATAAAGAMLGCFGEVTATTITSQHGQRKLELAIAARNLWPGWLDQLGPQPQPVVTASETVVLLNTVGSADVDSTNFAAVLRALRDADEPYEEIAVEDVAWLDPDSNARPLRALHLPNEGAVNPTALLNALTHTLEEKGVTLLDTIATGLWVNAGRIAGVLLPDTRIAAGSVVVAAGAASGVLARSVPQLRHRVPIVLGGAGVSALARTVDTTVPPYVLRTPNRAFACGLHVLPRTDGTVYLGATNEVTFEPQYDATIAEINILTTSAVRQIRKDLDGAHLLKVQVGNRPMSIDGWPLIGPTSIEGLWLVTGTYRDGLHLSPLLADEVAKRLTGGGGGIDIDMFRPEREPISTLSRSEVLDEVVRHTVATGFEARWHLDSDWPDTIGKFARVSFENLLDELGGHYMPPPALLSVLLKSSGDEVAEMRAYYRAVHAAWH
jgi:glycine/D-amino acid oxidase-like deaminating enzyme